MGYGKKPNQYKTHQNNNRTNKYNYRLQHQEGQLAPKDQLETKRTLRNFRNALQVKNEKKEQFIAADIKSLLDESGIVRTHMMMAE